MTAFMFGCSSMSSKPRPALAVSSLYQSIFCARFSVRAAADARLRE